VEKKREDSVEKAEGRGDAGLSERRTGKIAIDAEAKSKNGGCFVASKAMCHAGAEGHRQANSILRGAREHVVRRSGKYRKTSLSSRLAHQLFQASHTQSGSTATELPQEAAVAASISASAPQQPKRQRVTDLRYRP